MKKRTQLVAAKPSDAERAKEVNRLWDSKDNKAFDEIKKNLRDMAPGLERCMYCEDSAGNDIEHFWPALRLELDLFSRFSVFYPQVGTYLDTGRDFNYTKMLKYAPQKMM